MLNADDLTKDWAEGNLTLVDIREYLHVNLSARQHMSDSELDHVAALCFKIYEWSMKERPVGHFLTAVIENDLKEAVLCADDVNQGQLWVYIQFIHNCAPTGWKDRKDEKDS